MFMRLRLIYLHQYFTFPNETGGTRSYDLARSFVNKGINICIISATSDPKYDNDKRWNVIERDGLVVHYIYLPYGNHLSYFKRISVFFQFLWYSTFRLFKENADVILATSTPLTIGIPPLIKKIIKGTPYIFEVRDVWPEAVIAIGAIKNKIIQRGLYFLEKIIYKHASYIVPLSTDMRQSIMTRYPQYSKKTEIVIENIAEIQRFESGSVDKIVLKEIIGIEPRFSILYAGTFGKVNGIDYVVKLAKRTIQIDPNLVYILLGSGGEKETVVKLAEKEGVLNKNVFILNSVAKQELPSWYSRVDMGSSFVTNIPELWANSANKFFDTLASGRPILINHEGWQAKVIRDKNIGYVLPIEITFDFAKEFVDYTYDSELYKVQSNNALKEAKEKYSLAVATEKYLTVLSKIDV